MRKIILLFLLAAFSFLVGQSPSPTREQPKYGTLRLKAGLGSFRLEGEGRVEMTFRGTLMLVNFEGKIDLQGRVRKEFQGMGRTVWFGARDENGRLPRAVIEGKWRYLQWFGGDMQAIWKGRGIALIFGEYDENGDSGTWQLDNNPAYPWHTVGRAVYVPEEITPGYTPSPKRNGKNNANPKPETPKKVF
ncbi:MAG TPA: hypothetical protein VNK96_01750 [Fimbriimonadales bacterium]|nr:hypothetical protein [Fimbriimonadales bacterium]